MSLQLAANATTFASVLAVVVARLTAGVGGKIKTVAAPDNKLHEYTAEEGLLVRVGPPEPRPDEGAGRYGKRVLRNLDIVVMTRSLVDQAGQDPLAVAAHLAKEEAVVNALEQQAPVGSTYNLRTGIQIKWVPGGEAITRQIQANRGDPGMLISTLIYRIEYTAPIYVLRD